MSQSFVTDDDFKQPQNREQQAPKQETVERREAPAVTGMSFSDLRRMSGRPNMGGVSEAALQTLIDIFEGTKKNSQAGVPEEARRENFRLVPLDSGLTGKAMPALLVCLPIRAPEGVQVLTYTLILEQEGDIQTRPMTDRGETFDALVLPQNMLTDKYKALIRKQAAAVVTGVEQDKIQVIFVGHQLILSSTIASLDEKDSQNRARNIFENSLDAIAGFRENILDARAGSRNANRTRITPESLEKGSRLEITFDYSGKQAVDTSGMPVRSDVCAGLFYSPANGDDDLYTRQALGEVRAGLDLFVTYDSDSEVGGSFGSRRNRKSDKPFWQAVLNINSISAAQGFPFSLELAQLLLAPVALQSNDYRWASILRPRAAIGGGMKTIVEPGVLFLMHPDPEVAQVVEEVNSPNVSDDDLGDYLATVVHDRLAFGMTVPTAGERSWILNIYSQIALTQDEKERRRLIQTLFRSADVLTGRKFSAECESLDATNLIPVVSTGNQVLLGTWQDEQGNVRDLREWNVPAVLTRLREKKLDLVQDFQATFEDTRRSVERNLAERYDILKRIVPGLRVSGAAEQLELNPVYLHILGLAMDRANMSPHMSSFDGLNTRRRIGHMGLRFGGSADIGVARRGREETTVRRGGFGDGNYYY